MKRNSTAKGRTATELESGVLAIIEELGSCTRYAVRKYLAKSLSSFWSGSAGAIYPMLQRFTERGWVHEVSEPFGSREKRLYRLTPLGRAQLHRWLSAPVPSEVAAYNYDPLRTRVFFLDMVGREEQRAFLDDSIAKTEELVRFHQEERDELKEGLSVFDLHGREGALRELLARADWLREVRESLGHDSK